MSAGRAASAAGRAAAGKGNQGGSGPNAPGGNQYAGYRGPTGTRAPTSAPPGSYGLSGPETRAYDSAKMEYKNRSFGKRLLDFLSPLKSIDPQINQPSSWMGGEYHHGFNPGEVGGGILGSLIPGGGAVLGKLGGLGWEQSGMHDVVLTGPGYKGSTSYPDGGPGYNSSTGYGGPAGTPTAPQGKGSQSGTPLIPGPMQAPAIFSQQQQPAIPGPQAPQIFQPKPPTPSPFQVPGGKPYGFNIFGRTA